MTVKEIQAEYLVSSYFKDIYLYLAQNKLPSHKMSIKKAKALVEKYILLDSLLFKIVPSPDKESTVLYIQEVCTDKIINLYHSCLFAGHQGVIKTYLTISDKFFILNVIHCLHSYIKVVIYANFLVMKTTSKAIANLNQFKLYTIIKVKHGS